MIMLMKPRLRPRLADIAAAAGVSLATASRSLAQPEIVSPDTRAKVRAAALRLGGPHALDAARGLPGSGVAAIVPTLDNPIFARALQAMQAVLTEAGHMVPRDAPQAGRCMLERWLHEAL